MSIHKFDGVQAQQQVVEGQVPAALLVELAAQFYKDREADRALAREMVGLLLGLGAQALELAKAEAADRAERREAAERNARRERHEERLRNERQQQRR